MKCVLGQTCNGNAVEALEKPSVAAEMNQNVDSFVLHVHTYGACPMVLREREPWGTSEETSWGSLDSKHEVCLTETHLHSLEDIRCILQT